MDEATVMIFPPPAGLDHSPGDLLAQEIGGLEVHRDHLVELLWGDLHKRLADRRPRIVDQAVDPGMAFMGFSNHPFDIVHVPEVSGDRQRPFPRLQENLPGRLFQFLLQDVDQDQLGAGAGQGLGHAESDPPGRPGNHGNLSLQ